MPTIAVFILQTLFVYTISLICLWVYKRRSISKALKNIPGPKSSSFLTGNFTEIYDANGWNYHKEVSERYGGVFRVNALLGEQKLYVFDPKALHQIVVKDQDIFEETEQFLVGNRLMFGEGLLATMGDHHRKQRKMLNPVFSISHMREMTPIFWDIGRKLQNTFIGLVKDGEKEIDVTHWMTRTALELIGQGGLGYSFDRLTEDAVPHPFSVAVKQLVPSVFRLIILHFTFPPSALKIGTPRIWRWVVDTLPWKSLHHMRDIVDTMHQTSVDILTLKRRSLAEGDKGLDTQIAGGKDIMSILLRENTNASAEDRLDEAELIGQMSTFTFAAMDTTSAALSRILYLLCCHPEAQDKLRAEIKEALNGADENLNYDEMVSLPYLDAICRETLRLYPPLHQIERTVRQDCILSLSSPIKGLDGSEITEIPILKNTNIIISILSANRNSRVWGADSYEWKPERWLFPLPYSVVEARIPGIYSHLMTFLGGGRACIGFKFSQLEMKVILCLLVPKFKFSLSEKEIVWQMQGITSPTVKGQDPFTPSLPMKVNLA